jgi:hypothetical protein
VVEGVAEELVGDGLVVQAGAAAELLAGFVEGVNKNVMLFVDLGHAGDQAVVPDEGAGCPWWRLRQASVERSGVDALPGRVGLEALSSHRSRCSAAGRCRSPA